MPCDGHAGLLRQQAEQAATSLSALPSVTLADVKTLVSFLIDSRRLIGFL